RAQGPRPLRIAEAEVCLAEQREAPGVQHARRAAFPRDRHRTLERLDRLPPLASHPLRPAEVEPYVGAGHRAPDPLRDLEPLLGMAERGLGLSLEVRELGGPHVAPADNLDVPLLAGDLPPLLEQAACLLELAEFDEV